MNLTLGQLISVRQTYEKTLEQKLLEMDVWFQNHMWDGSGDENDPKYLTKEDFVAIEALTSKIKHMCLNIGCPNSVNPMIESIIARKLKRWQGSDSVETNDVIRFVFNETTKRNDERITKGFRKGKQLKNITDVARVKKSRGYYGDEGQVLVGHFRWNNRGYILSRQCTDLLESYYYSEFFTE